MTGERSGRTTRMLEAALKAAEKDMTVRIVATSLTAIEHLKRAAWDLLYPYEDGPERFARLKFVTNNRQLLGLNPGPLFADHQWVSDMQWVLDVMKEMEQ